MAQLKDNKTCVLLEQYLTYLTVVKGQSPLTASENKIDCLLLAELSRESVVRQRM